MVFDIYLDILFFFVPVFYIFFFDKTYTLSSLFKSLGFKALSFKILLKHTFILFSVLLVLTIILGIVSQIFGVHDLSLVGNKIASLSVGFLIYLFIVRVFLEELFFRGFLVPRIGVLGSSFLFSLGHMFYGSIIEVIGAFVLGVFLGRYFEKTKSLFPNYFAHLFYNLLSFIVMMI